MQKYQYCEFEITAPYGLFTDVTTKAGGEKYSYDVPTYEALKGIMKKIYWKPTLLYYIDQVRVMNPIIHDRKSVKLPKFDSKGSNDLAYYNYLKDVRYQVRGHFEWNPNRPEYNDDHKPEKHQEIFRRATERGGRRPAHLGTTECGCFITPCVFGEGAGVFDNTGEIDMGYMYQCIIYPDEAIATKDKGYVSVVFDNCIMKNGVITFKKPYEIPDNQKRHIRKCEMKHFQRPEKYIKEENI